MTTYHSLLSKATDLLEKHAGLSLTADRKLLEEAATGDAVNVRDAR